MPAQDAQERAVKDSCLIMCSVCVAVCSDFVRILYGLRFVASVQLVCERIADTHCVSLFTKAQTLQ